MIATTMQTWASSAILNMSSPYLSPSTTKLKKKESERTRWKKNIESDLHSTPIVINTIFLEYYKSLEIIPSETEWQQFV